MKMRTYRSNHDDILCTVYSAQKMAIFRWKMMMNCVRTSRIRLEAVGRIQNSSLFGTKFIIIWYNIHHCQCKNLQIRSRIPHFEIKTFKTLKTRPKALGQSCAVSIVLQHKWCIVYSLINDELCSRCSTSDAFCIFYFAFCILHFAVCSL